MKTRQLVYYYVKKQTENTSNMSFKIMVNLWESLLIQLLMICRKKSEKHYRK